MLLINEYKYQYICNGITSIRYLKGFFLGDYIGMECIFLVYKGTIITTHVIFFNDYAIVRVNDIEKIHSYPNIFTIVRGLANGKTSQYFNYFSTMLLVFRKRKKRAFNTS